MKQSNVLSFSFKKSNTEINCVEHHCPAHLSHRSNINKFTVTGWGQGGGGEVCRNIQSVLFVYLKLLLYIYVNSCCHHSHPHCWHSLASELA